MKLTLDTVATSFIDSCLLPGKQSSTSPFQFMGVRPFCTIEEVDKRAKELRFMFHIDRLDEKLDRHISINFKTVFSDEDWTNYSSACCM